MLRDDVVIEAPSLPNGIGDSGKKYEAEELALGDRGYIDDMRVPGMLHAALRLADHARADVLRIDTGPALAVEGVIAVYTAADIPGVQRVGIIHKDWPVMIGEGQRTSYLGDVLAVVVAEDVQTARAAADLIDIEYRELKVYADADSALAADEDVVWGLDGNVLSRSVYTRGDVDAALASCTHTVSETFTTQRVEHAFLEPESTLAVPHEDGSLMVYSGGQGVWDDRDQIADMLAVDKDRITVELVSNGGAFGGKEDMSNQGQTALAAFLLGQPVKCTLTRPQSLLMHAKRHPIRIEATAGCDENGKLLAYRARMIGDSGPYASVGMKVLERAAGHASGPYEIPNIDVEAVAVRTNNPVCGAFRGFGANQAQFATEGMLDRLADEVGISGWEIRNRNVVEPGDVWGPGQIMDDGCLGARQCLDAVKPAYDEARAAGKAVGLGLALKNSGLGNGFLEIAKAVVRFDDDGGVEVRHCWTEMGQGVHTVALQVAVEELGVAPEKVRVVVDTSRELGAGQTTGSRGTLMGAGSVADACRVANEGGLRAQRRLRRRVPRRLDELARGGPRESDHPLGVRLRRPARHRRQGNRRHREGRCRPRRRQGHQPDVVRRARSKVPSTWASGMPSPRTSRPTSRAMPTNMTLRSLGILRAKDIPEIEVILVEAPQPGAPYGVKGVGEIGLVPTAGAVAAAFHDVDGIRRNRLPMSPPQPAVS